MKHFVVAFQWQMSLKGSGWQCNLICFHNVKSIFVCPFSSGFGVSTQTGLFEGVPPRGYPLIYLVGKSLFQYHTCQPHPGPSVKKALLFLRATNAACNFSSPKNLVRILYRPTSGTLIILITTCISLSLFISDVDTSGRIKCHTSRPLNSLLDRMCC